MKTVITIIMIFVIQFSLLSRECIVNSQRYYNNQEYNKSIASMMTCLEEIVDDADPTEMDYTFFGIGNNHLILGAVDSALKYTLIAYDIEKKYDILSSKTLNQLGNIYIDKGLNHQAIYYIKKAILLNVESGNNKLLQMNYNNLGNAYKSISLVDSAIFYYQKSLVITHEDTPEYNLVMNNLSSLYFNMEQFEKSKRILDEILKSNHSANPEFDRMLYSTNSILLKGIINKKFNANDSLVLYKYLMYAKSNNEFYFADANYKLAIYSLLNNKAEVGISFLNEANSIYVSIGNIQIAKEKTEVFSKLLKNNSKMNLKYSLNSLNNLLIKQYTNSLNSEIETKLEAENYMESLNQQLFKAEISFYLVLSFLFSIVLIIGFIIYRIRTSKKLRQVINGYYSYLNIINNLDDIRLKNNLSKISNYMALDDSFKNKKYFTELVDEVIVDTNKIRKTVRNGIDFQQTKRLNNVNITTTN